MIYLHLYKKNNDFRRYGNNTLIDEQVLVKSGPKKMDSNSPGNSRLVARVAPKQNEQALQTLVDFCSLNIEVPKIIKSQLLQWAIFEGSYILLNKNKPIWADEVGSDTYLFQHLKNCLIISFGYLQFIMVVLGRQYMKYEKSNQLALFLAWLSVPPTVKYKLFLSYC